MTDRKKPGVAFWATVVVVVALAYPLSIGPLAFFEARKMVPQWTNGPIDTFYAPISWITYKSTTANRAMFRYAAQWGFDAEAGSCKNQIPQ